MEMGLGRQVRSSLARGCALFFTIVEAGLSKMVILLKNKVVYRLGRADNGSRFAGWVVAPPRVSCAGKVGVLQRC